MTDVFCYAEKVPSTGSWVFSFSPIDFATLHVPAGSVNLYKSTSPWREFRTIVPLENEIEGDTYIDGIYYDFTENEAEVTNGDITYSGAVTIPKSVTYKGKTYSVTSIGSFAFERCSGLTSVTIPESVTSIGDFAFWDCSGLTSVSIPNSVTSIGDDAFYGCDGLISVTIPNSVTSIGKDAFYKCSYLTSVTVGNGVTNIGPMTFYECRRLTSVTIGNNVTTIGQYAFYNCSNLTCVKCLSSNPPSIYSSSFSNSANITLYVCAGCKTSYETANYWKDFKEILEIAYIIFADANVKALCIANWDTNKDGELSEDEAAKVTGLGEVFYKNKNIISFDELQFFTGLTSIGGFAFHGCENLKSIVIPSSVKSIGNQAFYNCGSLSSVIIPNSVKSIGENSFSFCSNLTSVTISNSMSSISAQAFYRCISLNSITIPESVTSIGLGAFSGCSSLTSVTIPNSVTSIGASAFEGTAWFNNHPDGLVYAGNVAYKYKGKMPEGTKISIKEGTLGISASSFWNCSGLTSVTIPESIMYIGDHAFSDCRGLKDVYSYAENVPSTGSYAYYSSPISSATLHVPAVSVDSYRSNSPWKEFGMIISIGETTPNIVFADASIKAICLANWDVNGDGELSEAEAASVASLEEVFRGNNSITSFDELQYFTRLTGIGDNAFCLCRKLTSITMPNNIASIGNGSFRNCGSLTSVTIPNSVTSIGERAFSGCSSLTSIKVEEDNTAFDSRSNCNAIIEKSTKKLIAGCQNTIIPNGVTSIGKNAFESCSGLTSIIIPNGVTNIEQNAFNQCTNLASIIIPNSVKNIGSEAFCYCLSLVDITIPEGVTKIENNAFYYCNHLTSISIGNSVSYIGESAFANCYCLTSFAIPNSVTIIYNNTFYECHSLASVTIPNSVKNIASTAFSGCSSLTAITIPESVTSIGNYAFAGCSNLTSVNLNSNSIVSGSRYKWDSMKGLFGEQVKEYVIGNCVKGIGNYAFCDCSALTSITIPVSVTYIRSCAFQNCSSLKNVYCYAENVPSADSNAFENTNIAAATLHVPTGSVNLYKTTLPWSGFGSIIPLGGEIEEDNYIDGIYYNFSENDAEVTNGDIIYSGKVVIPSSVFYKGKTYPVTSIGENAFSGCTGLTSVTIPNSVTSIEKEAFNGCNNITSLNLDCENIEYWFHDCQKSLSTLIFGDNVKTIGGDTFQDCSYLTTVTWGKNVASIGKEAFKNCSRLSSIVIPESVTSIGNATFKGCSSLNSIRIPNSITSIGNNAFSDCNGLTSIKVEDGNNIYDSRDNCNAIIITETNTLITGCQNTIIPNSVTAIGLEAFRGCSGLTSITIPASVTYVGDNAFKGCTSLKNVSMETNKPNKHFTRNNSDERWHDYVAISGTQGVNDSEDYTMLLDNDINTKWCVAHVDGTIYIEFDATCPIKPTEYMLTTGNDTQSNPGRNPKSWIIKGRNSTSDDWTTLTTVDDGNMPSESFVSKTFSLNTNTAYRYYRFEVTSLVSGTIFQLSEFCFLVSDNNDEPIDDDTDVLVLGSNGGSPLFADCPLDSVFIGRNISYSTSSDKGYSPFYCNTPLRSVNISGAAKEVFSKEFYGCTNLKNVQIGGKMSTIGDYAFYGCTGLKEFYCEAEQTPAVTSSSFKNVDVSAVMLVVPDNSVELYKAHPIWRLFWVETETGLNEIGNDHLGMENDAIAIYNINGRKLSAPQKGINIIRMSDGTTRKVMIR